ncbi:hypothetical protein [Novosphingobium cyanobacteriorum]|uniref:DUF4440 domain-containing protein n=1 Tax=Novosphingobium cyanobacteriorum TaxID=3024215 RepID=A0ABT6CN80_9SPHN|nr:hypothetical protein [Novosphingobium cyanobacteriorum]MDF8335376.1 hypothetical protein [Novosphingobium cyanobacteriorum]
MKKEPEIIMSAHKSAAEVEALLQHYMGLFSSGDFETAATLYHMPFSWVIGPAIATAFNAAEFIKKMTAMRDPLVACGFLRSELVTCKVRLLGQNAALAGVEVARHYADGRNPEITGGTYIAHHDGTRWKLVSIIGHPIAEIVGLKAPE